MLRDVELYDAIRLDNLAYIVSSRFERQLRDLPVDDVPPLLRYEPTAIQIAAYFGSERVFFYLLQQKSISFIDSRIPTIHFAAAGGSKNIVKSLIESDPSNINKFDENGDTPMHYSTRYGHNEITKLLLENGGVPDAPNNVGNTPSHVAASRGDIETLKMLKDHGCSLCELNSLSWTPLYYSIRNKKTECSLFLINNHFYNTEVQAFISVMQEAAQFREVECVKALIDAGFDVLDPNHNDWSLMHFICASGCSELVPHVYQRFGRDAFTDIDRLDKNCAQIAAINGCVDVVKELEAVQKTENNEEFDMFKYEDKFGKTAFDYACEFGHHELVLYLIESGHADINHKDKLGCTPLHIAVHNKHLPIIKTLIDNKAEINVIDNNDKTSLTIACENNNVEIIEMLLDAGADMNVDTTLKHTAIMISVISNSFDAFQLLIERGADPTAKSNKGWNCLHFAATKDDSYLLELLAKDERMVPLFKEKNELGQTPLMIAVVWNKLETAEFLLQSGFVNVNEPDSKGNTPLHVAAKLNHLTIAKLLLSQPDINTNTKNNENKTALFVAVEAWSTNIIENFISRDDCNLNTPGNGGLTPFLLACKLGQYDTVSLFLKSRRVETEIIDENGMNAANFAVLLQRLDILKLIVKSKRVDCTVEYGGISPIDFLKKYNEEYGGEFICEEEMYEEEMEEDYDDDDATTPLLLSSGQVYISRTKDNLFDDPNITKEESKSKLLPEIIPE